MSKFIRSIGGCYVNNYGFDLYKTANGGATIRPVKLGQDLPKKHWSTFDSLAACEEFLDSGAYEDVYGAQLVQALKDGLFHSIFHKNEG